MELYIHIPFCVRKCKYCDFLSFGGFGCDADREHHSLSDAYIDVLCGEIDGLRKKKLKISTVFIGGGTPSVLDETETEKLLKTVSSCIKSRNFNSNEETEFTVECNPGTLTLEKLLLYKKYCVNRLSIGLQSTDNEILFKLGRIHTFEEFLENFELARKTGFKNINVDLISAVPGQSLENWTETLKKTAELGPEHISAYSLILEEGTPLYEMYMRNPASLRLPDEDTERQMYYVTEKILAGYGYKRYEISNYAKKGFECRHNSGYWTGEEYIGLGLGASSYLSSENLNILIPEGNKQDNDVKDIKDAKNIMKSNISDISKIKIIDDINNIDKKNMFRIKSIESMEKYIDGKSSRYYIEETLDKNAQMSEFCILGLRMCDGISLKEFKRRFGQDIYDRFGNIIRKFTEAGLLEKKEERICFTLKGLDLSNTVLSEFI
ncbi:MAG: radical SAM family heme chaperone HemW [Lachnospiraceae bacterium]|nr:radical SAM family heme chaperone HemW [Lachnospiraceae bacterium]